MNHARQQVSPAIAGAAEAGLDAVVVTEAEAPWPVVHVGPGALALLAFLREDRAVNELAAEAEGVIGRALPELLPPGLDLAIAAQCAAVAASGRRAEATVDVRGADGTVRAAVQYALSTVDEWMFWAVRRVHHTPLGSQPGSGHAADALTGVGTRLTVREELERRMRVLARGGGGFALVFLDIDGLKEINDTFGHPVGDVVLEEIGARLRAMVRGSDVVGRLGGDEFVLIWPGVSSGDNAQRMYRRILTAIQEPIEAQGAAMRVSASAGALLVWEVQDRDPDELLRDADAAMYEAKARRDGELVIFEPSMKAAVLGSLVTAGELREAVYEGQLELHGQPVLDIIEDRTAGVELLLRWRHPERGLLPPADFLAAADASDVMVDLGQWVMDEAVSTAARWERNGASLDYYRIGINVTPRQLLRLDIVGQFASALARFGTSAENFVFEVVESQALDAVSAAADQIRELRQIGARVGIDDFGKGFANLANLRDLPVDLIKVDRSLVSIHPTQREAAILSGVQSIAAAIGAEVVLEGVERQSQVTVARQCGVRFAQGYLLGMPQPLTASPPMGHIPAAS